MDDANGACRALKSGARASTEIDLVLQNMVSSPLMVSGTIAFNP